MKETNSHEERDTNLETKSSICSNQALREILKYQF